MSFWSSRLVATYIIFFFLLGDKKKTLGAKIVRCADLSHERLCVRPFYWTSLFAPAKAWPDTFSLRTSFFFLLSIFADWPQTSVNRHLMFNLYFFLFTNGKAICTECLYLFALKNKGLIVGYDGGMSDSFWNDDKVVAVVIFICLKSKNRTLISQRVHLFKVPLKMGEQWKYYCYFVL